MNSPEWQINKTGQIVISLTNEAKQAKEQYKKLQSKGQLPKQRLTFEDAFAAAGGTLARVIMQWGQYLGKSFEWIALNDPGWCLHITYDYESKDIKHLKTEREQFMRRFTCYLLSFPVFKHTLLL